MAAFQILYAEDAEDDLRGLRVFEARRVVDEVDRLLAKEPMAAGPRRKRLDGLTPPWRTVRPVWQLRVGDIRVFYEVDDERAIVRVQAIRRKGSRTTEEIL